MLCGGYSVVIALSKGLAGKIRLRTVGTAVGPHHCRVISVIFPSCPSPKEIYNYHFTTPGDRPRIGSTRTVNRTLAGSPGTPLNPSSEYAQVWRLSDSATRWLVFVILLAQCALPMWLSLDDHPLYAPDEGRYGTVSMNMLNSGDWLVPTMNGQPHLTKPPMVYWLQAASLKLIHEDELALRLPSVVAATLTVLITFGLGMKWGGPKRGLIASGLLSLMPLHLIIGRLAITDSLLTLFWLAALAAGFLAVRAGAERSRGSWGWAAAMWLAVALGLLTKGPLALVPVGVLLIWLVLAGQLGSIRHLHLWGVLLAVAPIGIWVWQIIAHEPEAVSIWKHEMLDRASGSSGDHPEPLWYYIPIVIGGLFPATATLSLPGLEYAWSQAWTYLRKYDLGSLLVLAVIVPFIGFTLMSGKLATYVLPLGPPLAILAASVVEARFLGRDENPPTPRKAMQSIAAVCLSTFVVLGLMIFAIIRLRPESLWVACVSATLPLVALGLWIRWPVISGRAKYRIAAVTALWLAGVIAWIGVFEFEDSLGKVYGTQQLIEQVQAQPGLRDPIVATVGYQDPTLFRYLNHPALPLKNAEIDDWIDSLSADDRSRAVLLAKEEVWSEIMAKRPEVTNRFVDTGRGTYRINTPVLILRPKPQ